MKSMVFAIGIVFFWSHALYAEGTPQTAQAVLYDAQGKEIGNAALSEKNCCGGGVQIILKVHDFTPGTHAFHIHEVGKCEPPDFKSAGGHFNPHGKKHGLKNPEGAHAGDLQNLVVGSDGTAGQEWTASGVTLGEGQTSLFDSNGSSLVIHANADDEVTDPAGNAGTRIACGAITK